MKFDSAVTLLQALVMSALTYLLYRIEKQRDVRQFAIPELEILLKHYRREPIPPAKLVAFKKRGLSVTLIRSICIKTWVEERIHDHIGAKVREVAVAKALGVDTDKELDQRTESNVPGI